MTCKYLADYEYSIGCGLAAGSARLSAIRAPSPPSSSRSSSSRSIAESFSPRANSYERIGYAIYVCNLYEPAVIGVWEILIFLATTHNIIGDTDAKPEYFYGPHV